MKGYELRKVAPLAECVGAALTGVVLSSEREETEPTLLTLSFEGRPDIEISVWHGMGASGFDIETSKT